MCVIFKKIGCFSPENVFAHACGVDYPYSRGRRLLAEGDIYSLNIPDWVE